MQYSIVNVNALDQGTRLDPEYYKANFLQIAKTLKDRGCVPLEKVIKTIKSFGAYSLCNDVTLVDKGIPFIRCKDVKEGFVDLTEALHIDDSTHQLLSKSEVNPLTVLLTMSGTVGNSAIANPRWPYPINSNQDIAKIVTNELIDPYYLTIFFNTKYGKNQTERLPIGSIQQHIFLWQLKTILIYSPSKPFSDTIAGIFQQAIKSLEESDKLYRDAEEILLKELDLEAWKPKSQLSFVKNYLDTKASGRIDAEYFQPKYAEIIESIKALKDYSRLDDLVSIKKCFEPGSEAYQDTGIPFIRVSNLSKIAINNDNQKYISESLYETLKIHQPQQGEILLSKDATPGIAHLLNDIPHKMIPSSGILRLAIKDTGKTNPEYLTLVLNSMIVQKQIERDVGGSVINHWLVDQVKNCIIPIVDDVVQKEISNNITQSFLKSDQSMRLIELAKRSVEIAIETNEKEAEIWINQGVKDYA